jgi:hypothetical protein
MTLDKAESQIKEILKQLESDTDSLIESIEVTDIEITGMGDDRKQLQRRVLIELRRNPGSHW